MPAVWTWGWTEPPPSDRQSDPLGFSSLAESIGDLLLPGLSFRTRRADEALWSLVGRVWAWDAYGHGSRRAVQDALLRFERALKLVWCARGTTGFAGVEGARFQMQRNSWDPDYHLLSNQFSQGLHGSYTRLLRAAGLVDREDPLCPTASGRALVRCHGFTWTESTGRERLHRVFDRTMPLSCRMALGRRVFAPPDDAGLDQVGRVTTAAIAAVLHRAGPTPRWRWLAARVRLPIAPLVAGGDDFRRVTSDLESVFADVVDLALDPEADAPARRLVVPRGFPSWVRQVAQHTNQQDIPQALAHACRRARLQAPQAVIDLHHAVWTSRRHPEPWVRWYRGCPQATPSIRPSTVADSRDLRWSVAFDLMRQTRWTP